MAVNSDLFDQVNREVSTQNAAWRGHDRAKIEARYK